MHLNRNSLQFRVLAPSAAIIAVVFSSLIYLVSEISESIQDDYAEFAITAVNGEVRKILSAAASEITTSQLMETPEVAETKAKSVQEALQLMWARMNHDGIILDRCGAVIYSSLPHSDLPPITAGGKLGFYEVDGASPLHCYGERFPLWNWRVISVSRKAHSLLERNSAATLLPLVAGGSLLMLGGVFMVVRRAINRPVAMMVARVGAGEKVDDTGIAEFDIIGTAINNTLQRLRERETLLEQELGERARVEQELRAKDEHVSRLLSCTEEGIFGIDMEGKCTFCNRSCVTMLGYESEEQLLGARMHGLIHHAHQDGTPFPDHECRVNSALRGEERVHVHNEFFWRADGSSFPVEYWAHPVKEHGLVCGAVVTFIDISQRKHLEDQLIQAQKMESVGRLAGGVAHDFNNLLTPIIGYSELLRLDLAENPEAVGMVNKVMKSAEKSKELIRQLLSFSRKQDLVMAAIDLNQVIAEFHDILRRTLRENIDLRLMLSDEPRSIRADRHQIEQIIMNLAVNAQDAIQGSGSITIETAPVLLDDEYVAQHAEVVPGRFMMLAVTDTGCGMDSTTRQRIFEPFFTTKGIGKGTGLGLATVYGIVRQHGGNIWVYSEPGRGTTFKAYFPVVDAAPEGEQPAETEPIAFPGRRQSILVVEDNEMVRNLVCELLSRIGYEVASSDSPLEALRQFAGKPLDLLVADVVMPDMTGPELYARMEKGNPHLRVLYMSGYTSNVITDEGILDKGTQYIQKPFAMSEFSQRVESILRSPPAPPTGPGH